MWSGRSAFENDACPVGDDLLGQLYRANEGNLAILLEPIGGDTRAMLALYCYRRSHLHAMGVAIAAICEERDLVQIGGRVGSMLFDLSRQAVRERRPLTASAQRRAITLSTAPLSKVPAMEDIDEEIAQLEVVEPHIDEPDVTTVPGMPTSFETV
jgi:hypothetical protein